jgi:hypothetical protein
MRAEATRHFSTPYRSHESELERNLRFVPPLAPTPLTATYLPRRMRKLSDYAISAVSGIKELEGWFALGRLLAYTRPALKKKKIAMVC